MYTLVHLLVHCVDAHVLWQEIKPSHPTIPCTPPPTPHTPHTHHPHTHTTPTHTPPPHTHTPHPTDDEPARVPPVAAELCQGHHQRGDSGTAGPLPHHGRLQLGDGQEGVWERGGPLLLDHGHGLLLHHQQGGPPLEGQPGGAGGEAQGGHEQPPGGTGAAG